MTQGELFPDPGRPPPRMSVPARAPRYVRRRSDAAWCEDCIRAIHLNGLAHAEPVRRATWLRVAAGSVVLLCEIHKSERQGDER